MFKLLKVEELQKIRENHAVVKKCTSKCGGKERLLLTSSLKVVVVVGLQCRCKKMRTNGESARKLPESKSFVRHWPARAEQSEFEMLSIPAKKLLACGRQNGGMKKTITR